MESLVIHAASRVSAEGFCSALSGFGAKVVEGESGRYQVEIHVGKSNRDILEALKALEAYVSIRRDGPPQVELDLDGRHYKLHATDAQAKAEPSGAAS